VPQQIVWSDKGVIRESFATIQLHFEVTGCAVGKDLTFYILPWETDHLLIGWPTLTQEKWLDRITDMLAVQRAGGFGPHSCSGDSNETVTDMDNKVVQTDDLLFVSDEAPPRDEGMSSLIPADNILTVEEKVELGELLERHKEVFVAKPAGAARVEPMALPYKEGWVNPPMEPPRVYPPRIEVAIGLEIDKQVNLGVVEEWPELDNAVPVHPVAKPDSDTGYRFTLDMRGWNPGFVLEPYPLPLISDILTGLRTAKYFAKLDLRNGFWQFPVREEDMSKVAFQWKGRFYRYRVVCMGNAASVYYLQRTMVRLLVKSHARGSLVYLDDVHVYAETWGEFVRLLGEVLSTFIGANLHLKAEKCAFDAREISVLGHLVSRDGIRISTERLDAVTSMPFPRNVRDLRRFLGMTNYMRDYVPNYSLLAKPLSQEVNTPPKE
jgi:hypothetical protein